mgnify:FL=1
MPSNQITPKVFFLESLTNDRPKAMAWVADNKNNPKTSGLVKFYQPSNGGVLVEAEFFGLPFSPMANNSDFFAMHIHNFPDCGFDFANVGTHYNPDNLPHPFHAGDLPPLLSNQGYAWTAFFDRRFTIDDIIGKSVIIHAQGDDFRSQPSGNPGKAIACGDIRRTY